MKNASEKVPEADAKGAAKPEGKAGEHPQEDAAARHADDLRARIEQINAEIAQLHAEKVMLTRTLAAIWTRR